MYELGRSQLIAGEKKTELHSLLQELVKGSSQMSVLTSWALGLALSCSLSLGLLPCLAWPRSSRPRKARRGKADRGRSRIPLPATHESSPVSSSHPRPGLRCASRILDTRSETGSDQNSDSESLPTTPQGWSPGWSPRGSTISHLFHLVAFHKSFRFLGEQRFSFGTMSDSQS